jgi:hypothetical protein
MSVDGITERPRNLFSRLLIRYLTSQVREYQSYSVTPATELRTLMTPGDILLVEGNQRFSSAIKYLTQSTWSHAAFFAGDLAPMIDNNAERAELIEANLEHGVIAVPVSKYEGFNTRICRPVSLAPEDIAEVAQFMIDRIGYQYDLKNVTDLARYLLPTPPVPMRWRRRLLAFGSGDPTRVICSTLIAQAFQSVRYPILPEIEKFSDDQRRLAKHTVHEVLHIRHHSLFAPRDFDISPYFSIIKPTIELGFDYKKLEWGDNATSNS